MVGVVRMIKLRKTGKPMSNEPTKDKKDYATTTPHDMTLSAKRKTPVTLTPDMQDEIVRRLSDGEYMSDILSDEHLPSRSTIMNARRADPVFDEAIRRAMAECMDANLDMAAQFVKGASEANDVDQQRVAEIYAKSVASVAEKLAPITHGALLKMAGADGGALTVAVVNYADKAKADEAQAG